MAQHFSRKIILLGAALLGICLISTVSKPVAAEKALDLLPKTDWRLALKKTGRMGRGLYQYGQPLVDGEVIYAGASTGGVFAVTQDGKRKWTFKTRGPVYASIALEGGVIYAADAKGLLYAINKEDGSEIWHGYLATEIMARPLIHGDRVYVATQRGEFLSIDKNSGVVEWRTSERLTTTQFAVKSAADPIVNGTNAIVGYADGRIVAHNLENGNIVWEGRVASRNSLLQDVDTTALPFKNTIITASMGSNLAALNANSGKVVWNKPVNSPNDLTLDGETLFVAGEGSVYALNANNGAEIWKTALPESEVVSPVIVKGYVITVSTTGVLYLMERSNGRLIARKHVGTGTYANLTVAGNRIYLVSNSGQLIALEM